MKILVANRQLPPRGRAPRHTGIARYCCGLVEGLRALGHEAMIIGPGMASGLTGWLSLLTAARRAKADLLVIGDPAFHGFAVLVHPWVPYAPVLYGTEAVGFRDCMERRGMSLSERLRCRLLRRYVSSAAQRIVISHYTRGVVEGVFGPLDTTLIYPPLTAAYLVTPVSPEPNAPVFHVTTIGRISERKNQLGTLRALVLLSRRHGVRFNYHIVGNVDAPVHEVYAQRLYTYIAEQDLSSEVTIHREATDEEVVAVLDHSNLCVALSSRSGQSVEGFGITAIEAGARERAVLVSNHGGLPEAVEDDITGVIAAADDDECVVAALRRVTLDAELRSIMGKAGRRRAVDEFTPARMATALLRGGKEAEWPSGEPRVGRRGS